MQKNRFYDQDPVVSQAVSLLLMLPGEMQTMAADSLSKIAETEYRLGEMIQETKSLGSDKIMALYKSKQKNREYDKNPSLHRAFNYLMLLTEENRRMISHRIVGLITQMHNYLKSCRQFSLVPTVQHLAAVTQAYLHLGPEEATRVIRLLEAEGFRHGHRKQQVEISPAMADFMAEKWALTEKRVVSEKNTGLHLRSTWAAEPKPRDA